MAAPPPSPDPDAASLFALWRRERDSTEDAFARTVSLAGRESWDLSLEAFAVLERRVRRHIRNAEQSLFPLFEIKTGSATELTRTLVQLHREIEDGLLRLRSCLRERDLDALPARVRGLRRVVLEHDGRASRLFYPLLDRLLTEEERRRVLSAQTEDEDG